MVIPFIVQRAAGSSAELQGAHAGVSPAHFAAWKILRPKMDAKQAISRKMESMAGAVGVESGGSTGVVPPPSSGYGDPRGVIGLDCAAGCGKNDGPWTSCSCSLSWQEGPGQGEQTKDFLPLAPRSPRSHRATLHPKREVRKTGQWGVKDKNLTPKPIRRGALGPLFHLTPGFLIPNFFRVFWGGGRGLK